MDVANRIERSLISAVSRAELTGCPPRLAAALQHSVFPKGARVRPRLCLSVAAACGDDHPTVSDAAGTALELLHCASLVHDDLPCFDNADTRRGRTTVHREFGEPLALLAGDALIVLAFQTLARAVFVPQRLGPLLLTISRAVGVPTGIVAGQAWECENQIDIAHYHRSKTGSLFSAATMAGAVAAGADPEPWRSVGEHIGEAYQVADDIRDAIADADEMGKPAGQDARHGRPNAVLQRGLSGAVRLVDELVAGAIDAIPPCEGAGELEALIASEAQRLRPKKLSSVAAA